MVELRGRPAPLAFERAHDEPHRITRVGWLRAAVLGANDGIVSVSSLLVGVAAADPEPRTVLVAGAAGLVAGAMSMAAGEYVSVSSQSDLERADIAREHRELRANPDGEERELVSIYRARGLSWGTARRVARELTDHDPLGSHLRDELGLSEAAAARPLQAAGASFLTFSAAATVPLAAALLAPPGAIALSVIGATLAALAALGALGAWAGRAPMPRAVARAVVWGAASMAATAGIGHLFGTVL